MARLGIAWNAEAFESPAPASDFDIERFVSDTIPVAPDSDTPTVPRIAAARVPAEATYAADGYETGRAWAVAIGRGTETINDIRDAGEDRVTCPAEYQAAWVDSFVAGVLEMTGAASSTCVVDGEPCPALPVVDCNEAGGLDAPASVCPRKAS